MPHTVIDSPIGALTVVATADGRLCGLYMEQQRHLPDIETFGARVDCLLPEVEAQLEEYFAGRRTTFDVPLAFAGTPFQQEVWNGLLDIPFGETWTYGGLAAHLGKPPGAARAVGLANGKNPISIIVPCHRVIGSTGDLTGYGGGLSRKRTLLAHESPTPALF